MQKRFWNPISIKTKLMNRVILYLAFYITGVTITIGQVKSEEILIKNNAIERTKTLTYAESNTSLTFCIHDSKKTNQNHNHL